MKQLLINEPELVNVRDEFRRTLLDYAIYAHRRNVVEVLLANKADVNAKSIGKTPLDWAVCCGKSDVVEAHGSKSGKK